MELPAAFPHFGVECPSAEMLGIARAALAMDSREAVARWAGALEAGACLGLGARRS